MAWFGIIRNIRRKICRHSSVRFTLVGVPLLWLLFICWAMYYTQSIERSASKRDLHFTITHPKQMIITADSESTSPVGLMNVLIAKIQNISQDMVILHALKPPKLQYSDTSYHQKSSYTRYINSSTYVAGVKATASQNKNNLVDTLEEQQEVPDFQDQKGFLEVPWTSQNLASSTNESANVTEQSSTFGSTDFVEFVWNGDKPKPVKKFIIPGFRFDPPNLGEHGVPVRINQDSLTPEERRKYYDGWHNFKFNEYASQLISTQRKIPDYRPYECKFPRDISSLPKASIIICFYNEAWSVLLRTIHSVFTMTQPELVEEIILVDDSSDLVMMHEPLEYYVAQVDKLRLLRMTNRSGLVRARLAGVKAAKAPVLVFLDSHVECEQDWLVPLLEVIVKHPNYAVTPEIDVIDFKDFSIHSASNNIGIFTFEGFIFDWTSVLPRIKKMIKSPTDPIVSPTMAGGLFAIRRDYFLSIGTYDTGLELWGGENMELSLKLWMCGGGILIHPCSKVAHVFRDESPYLVGKNTEVLAKNTARVVQVWADEYRELYFQGIPYNEERFGSVHKQQQLREKLQCHSFSWYLDNIYPEIYIRNSGRFLGKIASDSGLCVYSANTYLELKSCTVAKSCESTRLKEVRCQNECMDTSLTNPYVVLKTCDLESDTQVFEYLKNKKIYHHASDTCLTGSGAATLLTLEPCTDDQNQIWKWPENAIYPLLSKQNDHPTEPVA